MADVLKTPTKSGITKITKYFSPSGDKKTPKSDNQASDLKDIDLSSPFLTPTSTPTKNRTDPSGSPKQPTGDVVSKASAKLTEETKESSKAKPQKTTAVKDGAPKARGRKGRSKKEIETPSQPKAKTARKKSSEPVNRVLTDFFPVRRSVRRTRKEVKVDKEKELHEAVLSGRTEGLKVVDIEGKGRGVVASKAFARGDFVVEYAGDLISIEEAKKRETEYGKDSSIGCYMYYFNFMNKKYCIDATAESGKLGRLLNHSTKGNCVTKLIGIDSTPYLILVAAKNIDCEEELMYDYGDRSKDSLESHPWLKL